MKESITIDELAKIKEIGKSESQPILLDDLEPGLEISPEKGRSNRTKGFEEPRPDLENQEGKSKDNEDIDRQTHDNVDRQSTPNAPKITTPAEPVIERVYRTLHPFPPNKEKTKREIDKAICKKVFDKIIIEMPLSDAMKVSS